MRKMIQSKAIAFAMVLALILSMTCVSFAANNDPNMTVYETDYTTIFTEGTGGTVDLQAGPANSSWAFTGFTNKAGADNVQWSIVDGSIDGVTISAPQAVNKSGKWITKVTATVSSSAEAGSASIMVVNKATNAYVNFTIVVNPTTLVTTPADASFEVYSAASTISAISTGNGSVSAASHSSDRNFITVADSMSTMVSSGTVSAYNDSYGYVTSMTVSGTPIEPAYPAGWQYRVYRDTNNDNTYEMVGITQYLGYDDVKLQDGDIVQWKVGNYDDTALFAPTIIR